MNGDREIDKKELIHQLDTLWYLKGHRGEHWVRIRDVVCLIKSEKVKIKEPENEQTEVGK